PVALRDVLAPLAHRLEREHLFQARIRKARPERRVVNRPVAAGEPVLRLAEDERRAAHRLDAPGDIEVTLAGGNRVTGRDDRGEAGGAKPVDGHTRDR